MRYARARALAVAHDKLPDAMPRFSPLAITFDFYETLVFPRRGRGKGARGAVFMELLVELGLSSDPWEHQVLYDVFDGHLEEYDPRAATSVRQRYYENLAEKIFQRLNVDAPDGTARRHAGRIWEILGPRCLEVYPDVAPVLERLKAARHPMAVISNWQRGLDHFLVELGLRDFFDHVLVSAEVGSVKPDSGIFHEACRRLAVPPERVLHVGDAFVDDWEGGRAVGMEVLVIRREREEVEPDVAIIRGLAEMFDRCAIR